MLNDSDLARARAHPPLSKPPVSSALDGLAEKRWPKNPSPYPLPNQEAARSRDTAVEESHESHRVIP